LTSSGPTASPDATQEAALFLAAKQRLDLPVTDDQPSPDRLRLAVVALDQPSVVDVTTAVVLRSSRLPARSAATSGLRQQMSRSAGKSSDSISARLCSSN
jgi:hypothetical protein